MTTIDYTKAGHADAVAQTPWDRCPITFEDWQTGTADTMESIAYWRGFDATLEDAFSDASLSSSS